MSPMSELEVLRGMQANIAQLDLSHPHAVECCIGLAHLMERQATRALDEMKTRQLTTMQAALREIAAADFQLVETVEELDAALKAETLNPAEDAEMDLLQAKWELLSPEMKEWCEETIAARSQEVEAERISNAHVDPFFSPLLATVCPVPGFPTVERKTA